MFQLRGLQAGGEGFKGQAYQVPSKTIQIFKLLIYMGFFMKQQEDLLVSSNSPNRTPLVCRHDERLGGF